MPIYGSKHETNRFYNAVLEWYKEQVENDTSNEGMKNEVYSLRESFVLSLFEKINTEFNSEKIAQITNDTFMDRGVRKIFVKYRRDYTTKKDVEDSVMKMIGEISYFLDNGKELPAEPMLNWFSTQSSHLYKINLYACRVQSTFAPTEERNI